MKYITIVVFVVLVHFLAVTAAAQGPCMPPEIVHNKNVANIFSEEQEMYLGDVMAETLDKNFLVLQDEAASKYLQEIGNRLIKHLPPTNIKFRFFVVDSPELNAFNVAGGRIYVTRKLISFVRSEDELAGILGHELGHGIVRHHSTDVSKLFKEILGIDRVGDRRDVFEKFNQYLDRQRTKRVKKKGNHEGDQQLEADRIGLFAMMAAGYDPSAYATAWGRMAEIKGTGGGSLGDLLGTTKPEEKRLREILKTIGKMPQECLDSSAEHSSEAFSKWQSYVVSIATVRHKEKFRGLVARGALSPYLRGSVRHFQFSPDGKYIIAQDASGINVLKREPFSFLFRVNVDDAKYATFSPDSKTVVFQTHGLRVEVWDIETRKAALTREAYVRGACWQTALSPDGKTLVCYSGRGNLDLIDVATNEKIFSKEKFYLPSFFEYITWQFSRDDNNNREIDAMEMEFSPDGRYFLGGRVFRLQFGEGLWTGPFFSLSAFDASQEAFIAYDLSERKELKLPASLKNIVSMPFAFYSNDRIIGQHRKDPEKSGIFTFPGGERVEKFLLSANSYEKPSNGDYILVRPTKMNPVAVYSVPQKKFLLANKTPAMDGWGDFFVSEAKDGYIDLVKASDGMIDTIGTVALPASELGDVRTIAVSDTLDKLAVSESARGGVWDLSNGALKVYIRGFRGSYIDAKGHVYADFPYYDQQPRTMAQLDPATGTGSMLEPVETVGTQQFGRLLVRLKTKAVEEIEKRRKKRKDGDAGTASDDDVVVKQKPTIIFTTSLLGFSDFPGFSNSGATLEVSDAVSRSVLWSMTFEDESPKYNIDPRAETVSLYWPVSTKSAREIIKKSPDLAAKSKLLGEKEGDYLVQVLNSNTGQPIGAALIETGEGSFTIERVFTAGDWLTIIDSENRILFYSLKGGDLRSRVFGENAAISVSRSIAAVENVPGILSIVDLNTGRRIDELRFPSRIAHVAFDKEGGRLFVLTTNQRYYIFNAGAFGAAA